MWEWNFANDNGSVPKMEKAKKYVAEWNMVYEENIGLLLWGGVGTGKTYMAAAIANALLDKGEKVKMIDFSEIASLSYFESNEYVNSLSAFSLIIIDDLGAESNSNFALQNVMNVINRRCEAGKPFIVTTNLTLGEIKYLMETDKRYGRIYDRMLDICKPIEIDGTSKRKATGKHRMEVLTDIFTDDIEQKEGEADE